MKKYVFVLISLLFINLVADSKIDIDLENTYKKDIELFLNKVLTHEASFNNSNSTFKIYDKGKEYFEQKDYENALKWLIIASQKRNNYALEFLSYMFFNGKGVKHDKELAFKLFLHSKRYTQGIMVFSRTWQFGYNEKEMDPSQIFELLIQQADKDNIDAFVQLGTQYLYGSGAKGVIEKDKKQAYHWYKKAAQRGDLYGVIRTGKLCLENLGIKQECAKNLRKIESLSSIANADIQYLIGMKYYDKHEYEKAKKWFLKPVESLDSRKMLLQMHFSKKIVCKNINMRLDKMTRILPQTTVEILQNVYDGGNHDNDLVFFLAKAYENTHKYNQAVQYYEILLKKGLLDEQKILDISGWYQLGYRGFEQDLDKSLYWSEQAVKINPNNHFRLVGAYKRKAREYADAGNKSKQEEYERKYFDSALKSAKAGNIYHQGALAGLYETGKGAFMKSDKNAFVWYKKVAMLNSNVDKNSWYLNDIGWSRYKLGEMYFYGRGVQKNYLMSYVWLNLSLAAELTEKEKGYAHTLMRRLEGLLSKSQIIYAQNHDPINEKIKKSKKDSNPSNGTTGTGFFVNKSYMLTNDHVVKNCKKIEIQNENYKSEATVVVSDAPNDLAILKAKKQNNSYLMFRSGRGLRTGNEIVVLGYPLGSLLGSGIKLTSGNISGMTGLVNDATKMQLTAPVQPGNSGGPLLDRSGNTAGVIVARLEKGLSGRTAQNVNLAIKSNVAQMFLDTNSIDYEVKSSKGKKELADIADEAKASVVQIICYQ